MELKNICTACGRGIECISHGTLLQMFNQHDRVLNRRFFLCERCAYGLIEFLSTRSYIDQRNRFEEMARAERYKTMALGDFVPNIENIMEQLTNAVTTERPTGPVISHPTTDGEG